MPGTQLVSRLLVFSFFLRSLAQDCSNVCQSFGKDFVDTGVYFQNVQSTDTFTATGYFAGCQDDIAYNVLRDPHGNQHECNNTSMRPDGALKNLTCPINKNQLISGEWSIIVLSNNGECDPIDFIRTFSLDVGTQVTTTVAPTVIVSSTSTPVLTTTQTVSSTITSTAKALTSTVHSANSYTFTITPLPAISIVTKGVFVVTQTVVKPTVVTTTTVTTTTPCFNAHARIVNRADKTNTAISVTVIKEPALTVILTRREATAKPTARAGSLQYKRAVLNGGLFETGPAADSEIAHTEIEKRAPDLPTLTVTSGTPVSITNIVTAATTTVGATSTTFLTSTSTPTVTVTSGQKPPTITTASQKTLTATFYIPLTVVTTTQYLTTITTTSTASTCVTR